MTDEDRLAAELREFGVLGILAILVIVLVGNSFILPLGAILALVWARRSHTPLRELGFTRPKSWIGTVVLGIVFGAALKLLLKSIVLPLLGADPINHAFHDLAGNRTALPGAIYTFVGSAGFGEETVFRGFLFQRFGRLFGVGAWGKALTLAITSILFGLAHYQLQGLTGVGQAIITGLVFGTMFLVTGRIWMAMVAHAAYNLVALGIIYWNLETTVAHWVFK